MPNFPTLYERWYYQSFCAKAGGGAQGPQIAAPWSPRGELTVKTDPDTGKVSGELVFSPQVKLAISGALTLAAGDLPDGIELTAEGLGSVSTLRGYFIYGASVLIAGKVVAIRNDPAKQPVGTSGAFVLFPGLG